MSGKVIFGLVLALAAAPALCAERGGKEPAAPAPDQARLLERIEKRLEAIEKRLEALEKSLPPAAGDAGALARELRRLADELDKQPLPGPGGALPGTPFGRQFFRVEPPEPGGQGRRFEFVWPPEGAERRAAPAGRAWLGVSVQDVSAGLAEALGLEKAQGALVNEVVADGPAAKAGVAAGDVVTAVGERAVKSADELVEAVAGHKAGDAVELKVVRKGQEQTLKVELAAPPRPRAGGRRGRE